MIGGLVKRRAWLTLITFLSMGALPPLRAQDAPPLVLGDFETQGSVTAGYRFTSVKGRQQKFLELFNLKSGLRLMDFNLQGRAKGGSNPFADSYSLNLSGLGGDPYPGGQFTVRKNKLYDLRVNYRESHYYWDRNDDVLLPLPSPAPSPPIQRGLTSNHDLMSVRKFGSANLLLHATNNLRFTLEINRTSRDGQNNTTRVMEYFDSPSSWGSFLRDNPYLVDLPLNESANRIAGGLSYAWRDWNFQYRLGYQTFVQNIVWNSAVSPERSINVDTPRTADEPLTNASWSEFRQLKTPVSEFSYNGKANSRVSLRGGYIFYRYRGPSAMDAAFAGTARSGSAVAPYAVAMNSRAQVTEPNHVVDQGMSVKITPWWNAHVDYRYAQMNENNDLRFHSLRDGVTADDALTTAWRSALHQVELNMEFTPLDNLVVRPGIRYMNRDIQGWEDGVVDPIHTKKISTVWPTVSAFYQPTRTLSLRGDFQSTTNAASYTRISPHSDLSGRFVVRYRPTEKLSFEENLALRTRKFLDTAFRNTIRTNSFIASYALDRRLSVYGGFSYDDYSATAAITFIRGTPPLDATWRDQALNRVWQGGISTQPWRRAGFNVSGNFIRTTGTSEISGEPPAYGPLTWPLITATGYYDFPSAGRLSIDLQRTYYVEDIIHGDDFGANLLTLRWTKDF
jgi:hypothetical protein